MTYKMFFRPSIKKRKAPSIKNTGAFLYIILIMNTRLQFEFQAKSMGILHELKVRESII